MHHVNSVEKRKNCASTRNFYIVVSTKSNITLQSLIIKHIIGATNNEKGSSFTEEFTLTINY